MKVGYYLNRRLQKLYVYQPFVAYCNPTCRAHEAHRAVSKFTQLQAHTCSKLCDETWSKHHEFDESSWKFVQRKDLRAANAALRQACLIPPSKLVILSYFITLFVSFLTQLFSIMSQQLQAAYEEAGKQIGASASLFARALQAAKARNETIGEDKCLRILKELTQKENVYAKPSMLKILARQISQKPASFVAFEEKLVQAGVAVDGGEAQILDVPLSSIANVDANELKILGSSANDLDAKATVKLDVIRLKSSSNTSASNAGAIVVAAVDGRANNPEDAVLGGMVHLPHKHQEADCIFFPSYCVSTYDQHMDKALRIMSSGSGFNLQPGSIVSTISYALVGELSAQPGRSTFCKQMAEAMNRYCGTSLCYNGLPIHPYRPQECKVEEVVLPWASNSHNVIYSGREEGFSTWKPDSSSGPSGIKISGLKSIKGPGVPRLNQSRRHNFEAEHDRDIRMEGSSDEHAFKLNERETLPGMLQALAEDQTIVSEHFEIEKIAGNGRILKTFNMFEDCSKKSLGRAANLVYNFFSCAFIKPIFKVELIFEVPIGYTVPLLLCYDPLRQVDDSTPKSLLLNLESIIVNPRDRAKSEVFLVSPPGHTGCFSPWQDRLQSCGAFHVASIGHTLANMEGKILAELRIGLAAGTIFGSGELPPPPLPDGDFMFYPGHRVQIEHLRTRYLISHITVNSKTQPGTTYKTLLRPAIGYVFDKGRKSSKNTSAALFSHYNFWNATVEMEILLSSRRGVAGTATIYFVPSGIRLETTSPSWLAQFPNQTFTFSGPTKLNIHFDNYAWLGGSLCHGENNLQLGFPTPICPTIITILQSPPSAAQGSSSEVHLFYRVTGFRNLELYERASLSYIKAPSLAAPNPDLNAGWAALVKNGQSKEPLAQGSACATAGFSNGSRILTVVPFDGELDSVLVMPASPAILDSNFNPESRNMVQMKLTPGSIFRDQASLLAVLISSTPYFRGRMRFWFIPTYVGNEYRTLDVAYLNNPLENYSFGLTKMDSSFQRTMYGGLVVGHSTRGEPIALDIPARHIFSRSRIRHKDNINAFLDSNGLFVVRMPSFACLQRLDVFCELLEPIHLWGFAIGREDVVDAKSQYVPATIVLPTDSGGFNEFYSPP